MTEFIINHSYIINIPMFLLFIVVVITIIGWYFSTDYYDKIDDFIDCSFYIPVSILFIGINVICVIYEGDIGFNIVLNGAVLLFIILPVLVEFIKYLGNSFMRSRMYFRKKRGKW